jgi:hypothetical protein
MPTQCLGCDKELPPTATVLYIVRREWDDRHRGRQRDELPFGYAHTECEGRADARGYRLVDFGKLDDLEAKRRA